MDRQRPPTAYELHQRQRTLDGGGDPDLVGEEDDSNAEEGLREARLHLIRRFFFCFAPPPPSSWSPL